MTRKWPTDGGLQQISQISGALGIVGTVTGEADAGSTAGSLRDADRTEPDDELLGQVLIMTGGANAGLSSVIVDFVAATDDIFVEPDFPNVIADGDTYTILPRPQFSDIIIGNANVDNVADTSLVVANRDGSVLERVEEIADDTDTLLVLAGVGAGAAVNRDMPWLVEFWETESLDGSAWNQTLDGSGTGAFNTSNGYMYWDLDTDAILDNDVFLASNFRWQTRPGTFDDPVTAIRQLVLEFEVRLTGSLANHDNSNFFLGLVSAQDNDISINDLAGFILVADALKTLTDNGGTEESTLVGSPPTLTVFNKYRIEVFATGYRFYVNETLVATHVTQIPNEAMYVVLGTRAESAVVVGLDIGNVRIWYEEAI